MAESKAENPVTFERSTPVLRSADYPRSRAFYEGKLGYTVAEEGGTPARFGIFKRGASVLFVNAWQGGPPQSPGGWDAYVHVVGVDALEAEFRAAQVDVIRATEDTVYGMREFEIRDPDGNVICFGEDADEATTP